MKNLLIIIIAFFSINISAQTKLVESEEIVESKIEVLKIKTSAECGSCKKRIGKALKGVTGIEYFKLNIPTKILKVKYDSGKISPDEIRNIVARTGYDADDVLANKKAYKNLPACCQKGGMDN